MAEEKVLLEIEGMTCDGCAQTVQHALEREKGVKTAEVDWQSGVAEVTFDREQTDEEQILDNPVFGRQYQARLTGGCC